MGSEVKFNSINQDLVERAGEEKGEGGGRTRIGRAGGRGRRYAYAVPLALPLARVLTPSKSRLLAKNNETW